MENIFAPATNFVTVIPMDEFNLRNFGNGFPTTMTVIEAPEFKGNFGVLVAMGPEVSYQMIRHTSGDEGHSTNYVSFAYSEEDAAWLVEMGSSGRDCDGPIESSRYTKTNGKMWLSPFWGVEVSDTELIESTQRDHFAEAAGY